MMISCNGIVFDERNLSGMDMTVGITSIVD